MVKPTARNKYCKYWLYTQVLLQSLKNKQVLYSVKELVPANQVQATCEMVTLLRDQQNIFNNIQQPRHEQMSTSPKQLSHTYLYV